jgi:Glycosyl transferase family 2
VSAPWLSVIMPTFNGAAYLPAALESVRAQAASGIELIAVDDGSDDGTVAALEEYGRILPLRVVRRARSGNWVAGSNHGLSLARSEYACFLHQDDLWLPGRVNLLRRAVEAAPDAALVVHPSWFVDERGDRLGLWRCPLPRGRLDSQLVVERLIVQNFLAIPAPVFRRELALRAGGMDEALWYTADWDLWLTLARIGSVVHEPEPLAAFRVHAGSQTSQRTRDRAELRRQLEAVLRKHLPSAAGGKDHVAAAAAFSVELNVALAGSLHRRRFGWGGLLKRFVSLGPRGWHRFLRDSRIAERVGARLRRGLRPGPT